MKALVVIIALVVAIYATSAGVDAGRERAGISPHMAIGTGRFVGPSILGFADVVADGLWLIANEYFWNKEYLKLFPLFRSITWLDPHYILVYKIGGWHLAYNMCHVIECSPEKEKEFVDSGIKFLEEGIANNPDRYDLYFELGWLYFEKEKNYKLAAKYFRRAIGFEHPLPIDHMLAHSYARGGELDKALKEWKRIVEENPSDSVAVRHYERLKNQILREE